MAQYIKTEDGYKTVSEIGIATLELIETAQVTANSKMDAKNPVGSGTFSMNRKANTDIGNYSHAEGYNTTASGWCSHAEGYNTTASGWYSHAEGYNTTASGLYSHAEGYNTTASGRCSHVQGVNNIIDVCNDVADPVGKYINIVGNGTHPTERSNAYTLDWNGVGWFQGGLQVGGNAQDDGAKNVLLEGDAIPVPTIATVGQTIIVKAVDENGAPTEWECVDYPTKAVAVADAAGAAPTAEEFNTLLAALRDAGYIAS